MRKFAKNPSSSGMTTMKIMVVPCIVNIWLYVLAERKVLFGTASCVRMAIASTPPISMKTSEANRYRTATRL